MKHIDADKLRAGIESINLFPQISADYNDGREDMKMAVLDIIDSLQQDETQVDKMLCSQVWWEEQGWIMIPPDATIEGIDSLLKQVRKKLQQEQPEVDLEKELDRYLRGEFKQTAGGNFNNYIQVAHHFYELGRNARKEDL